MVSTNTGAEAGAGAVPPATLDEGPMRRGAQPRVISITTAPDRGSAATRAPVTLRKFLGPARAVRDGRHLTGQHPSLAGQWQRHRDAAVAWGETSPALGAARLAWGCVHMVIKAVLDTVHWVTEEPARFAAAAIIVLAARLFH